ncbi:MAG: DASS family sodium-coupled anion symporter [Salinibacter sp.]
MASGALAPNTFGRTARLGLLGGGLVFSLVLALPAPEGLDPAGWRVAAVGLLMALWWITEALPISVTALLPLVLFPVLGAGSINQAATPYANPLIFLFMGGFMIALAMQRWGLHRRIALSIIRAVGTEPHAIVFGFMLASAFLSMWVSNTATAMMMLPIGLSVVRLAGGDDPSGEARTFAIVLMLSIAYACSIGGTATIIGTPPNALLQGFLNETYDVELSFARWMALGVPFVVVGLPLAYGVLTRVAFSLSLDRIAGGRALITEALDEMGPASRGEWLVGFVFSAVALLWMTRPLLADGVPGLSDAGIAMGGAVVLFLTPVDWGEGTFVLDWETAADLPWGVLLLFGGGLSLASAVERTGLASWIGEQFNALGGLPIVLLILAVTLTIVLMTELTSNTATTAAFLPIMASVAIGVGQDPYLLIVPAALAASCAFMLPVATPPNAIVYGSEVLSIPEMARAGAVLNVLFIVLITAVAYGLAPIVLGVEIGVVPPWAG